MLQVNQQAIHATKATILERGQQALIKELGPTGAMDFLQESAALERPASKDDDLKRLLTHIDIDWETKEVVIRFNQPTTWLRFTPNDALEFVRSIAVRAQRLLIGEDA